MSQDDDVLVARARALARVPALALHHAGRALVAQIGSQRYGFAITTVVRVRRVGPCTPVPHAPASIIGVAKLEGRITAVYGGRTWRGLPEQVQSETPVVILEANNAVLALLVDEVLGTVEMPADVTDLRRPGEPWLRAIVDDVLIVDVDRMIESLSDRQGTR